MIVSSMGALIQPPDAQQAATRYGSIKLYTNSYYSYERLYKLQPNVRTCVDFLARNVAQLGLHVYQRVSDVDRKRLTDHPMAALLSRPNPWTTRYRLIESLMGDLGIYFNAYWVKIKAAPPALLRIPPSLVTVYGGLSPLRYEIAMTTGAPLALDPEAIVHFRGYNPEDANVGLSPMESLRRILAEEQAMGDYRENFWTNAARMGGIIERPREAPEWSAAARERFKAEFEALYSGASKSGATAILEEGMQWKQIAFSAQESEYLGARKLTREECARAYHIPLPMVGILDNATFSNIREQHKNLYQDCLGPWLKMIEEEIELQLLPWLTADKDVYCEFNIAEKLAGSFEEQTQAMQAAIGRPWMTANEGRARFNLPSLRGDADDLVTPLNVLTGGQASPRDADSTEPKARGAKAGRGKINPTMPALREKHVAKWAQVLRRTFERQRDAVLGKLSGKAAAKVDDLWDADRWNQELGADIYKLNTATAVTWARYMADVLDFELDEDRMSEWLRENAERSAENINGHTRDLIVAALGAEVVRDAIDHLFEVAMGSRAEQAAVSAVTTVANFGAQEGARQGGLRTKTWEVNSANPRPDHAAMNGETVPIDENFSNGMRWPGDPGGGADNNAGCQCSVSFGR